MLPSLLVCNKTYFKTIAEWNNLSTESVDNVFKIAGAEKYNHIVEINQRFSNSPTWQPIDRTGFARSPIQFHLSRPWQAPTCEKSFDQVLQQRVHDLTNNQQTINIFWSGGIDSTTVVTAFLKHHPDKSQLRILYSPWSTYEHPGYLDFLKKFDKLELVDISGTTYMDTEFDGIHVTGDGGDELMASLDESFFEVYGYQTLHQPWKDFFYKQKSDDSLIEFCEQHFAQAGRPIDTVLEARWWFYATCKNNSIFCNERIPYFIDYKNFDLGNIHGFFDCDQFENFIYWNIDQAITGQEYHNWKQIFKNYCYEFDGFENWWLTKTKLTSSQTIQYTYKKLILKNQRWLMILSDGTKITVPSLPLLSKKEYFEHNSKFDYLFRYEYL